MMIFTITLTPKTGNEISRLDSKRTQFMFSKKNTWRPIHYLIFLPLMYCIFPSVVLLIVVIFNRWPGREEVYDTSYNWRQEVPPRSIFNPSRQFDEIWSVAPVYAGSAYDDHGGNVYLSAQGEDLFVLASLNVDQLEGLNRLNMLTGEIEWQASPKSFKTDDRASVLTSNSQFAYVGFDGLGKIWGDILLDASSIVAMDMDSGTRDWSRLIGGARSIWSVNATDIWVSVSGDTSSHYYLLDATTGEIVQKERKISETGELNGYLLAVDGNILFETNACISLQATNLAEERVIWVTELDHCVGSPAITTDDSLILVQGGIPGEVVAFDKATGEIKWRYDQSGVVSNVAVGDGPTAYFLTTQAELLAVDVRTGDVLATLEFIGDDGPDKYDNTPDSPLNYVRRPFSVAASENIIVVHLGDSSQLFAFRFISNE